MSKYGIYALRFFFILALQVFMFQNIPLGHINVYLYPAFVLFLPSAWLSAPIIFFGFFMGGLVDLFYDTDGLHAASGVFSAMTRTGLLVVFEPRGGYDLGHIPNRQALGTAWYMRYSAAYLALHVFFLTLLEELGFSWFWLLQFIFEFGLAFFVITLYQYLFNPR